MFAMFANRSFLAAESLPLFQPPGSGQGETAEARTKNEEIESEK
jgi:hypothetical protein